VTLAAIPRLADLVEARGDAPPVPEPGRWLVAGTPVAEPYPCVCRYTPCKWPKCPDAVRAEGEALPAGCCGRRNLAVRADGFEHGAPADWTPRQRPSGGRSAPGVAVGTPEPVSALLDRARGAGTALACDCPTPWDPPPPLLLIAESKTGPIREHRPIAASKDPRALADVALAAMGLARSVAWRDGRHTLLPPSPGSRGKTRPCWHAPLADGSLAVLDTPDETGSGVHCPDCHANFANAGAWEVHRARDGWRAVCKDPATVLVVEAVEVAPAEVDLVGRVRSASRVVSVRRSVPMLKRGMAGVWQLDGKCPWGGGRPGDGRRRGAAGVDAGAAAAGRAPVGVRPGAQQG
jgi:hypothetical protein